MTDWKSWHQVCPSLWYNLPQANAHINHAQSTLLKNIVEQHNSRIYQSSNSDAQLYSVWFHLVQSAVSSVVSTRFSRPD